MFKKSLMSKKRLLINCIEVLAELRKLLCDEFFFKRAPYQCHSRLPLVWRAKLLISTFTAWEQNSGEFWAVLTKQFNTGLMILFPLKYKMPSHSMDSFACFPDYENKTHPHIFLTVSWGDNYRSSANLEQQHLGLKRWNDGKFFELTMFWFYQRINKVSITFQRGFD